MDFDFTEEQNTLRESVRKMMDRHATPEYIRRLDGEQANAYEHLDARVEMGLPRMPFPEKHGGPALNRNGSCILRLPIVKYATEDSLVDD